MFALPRTLLIFALCLPLAVLMGFMLADPMASKNMMIVSATFMVLLMPILLSFHHIALVWSATAFVNVFFLPGQPNLWMLCAGLSLGISIVSWPLSKGRQKPLWVPSVAWSLIFLTVVAVVTSQLTGGIGTRAMGSDVMGGKKYFWLFGAVIGFFAISMHPIPRENILKYLNVYTLGGCTAAFSNVAYFLGPSFYFLFYLFPVDFAITQASADWLPGGGLKRVGGLGPAALALTCFIVMRWGIKDLLDVTRPYRLFLLLLAISFALLSGFRSMLVLVFLILLVHALVEGVHRTKLGFALAVGTAVAVIFTLAFSDRLPLAAQRTLSFLPVKVDSAARADAKLSLEWRLDMWSVLWGETPRYIWLGKGYAINPTDMYFANESLKRGFAQTYDQALVATDFHSGPFSVLIPFGIWGVIGFVWFLIASLRVLLKNRRYGAPELRRFNDFFLSLFIAKTIFFLFIFGAMEVDLWMFSSIVALSLAINHGAREEQKLPRLTVNVQERRERARAVELAGV